MIKHQLIIGVLDPVPRQLRDQRVWCPDEDLRLRELGSGESRPRPARGHVVVRRRHSAFELHRPRIAVFLHVDVQVRNLLACTRIADVAEKLALFDMRSVQDLHVRIDIGNMRGGVGGRREYGPGVRAQIAGNRARNRVRVERVRAVGLENPEMIGDCE